MHRYKLLTQLFDEKILKVLNLFISGPEQELYLREISRLAGISPATTYRILKRLVSLQILSLHTIKRSKVYTWKESEDTEFLKQFIKADNNPIDEFVTLVKQAKGVEKIIHHGTRAKNKANLLIIGQSIDKEEVESYKRQVEEGKQFHLSLLSLTTEQFEQMSAMGLYSGKKKLLFGRMNAK